MLAAFPNPSENGVFTLALKNFDATSLTVKVFDATGKVFLTKQIGQVVGDRQEVLDLQGQPVGCLFAANSDRKEDISVENDENVNCCIVVMLYY